MDLSQKLQTLSTQYQAAVARFEVEQEELTLAKRHVQDCLSAQDIVQRVSQAVQQAAHQRIASVVTRCLEAVFDDPYEFRIEFERKRGRTEASLQFVRGDVAVDPLSASGGGVVDVAAFALRLSCLMLTRPPIRKLLVLDEPFRFLSVEYRERVRQLLETLAREMGVQIIMVTHSDELRCGKVVEIT